MDARRNQVYTGLYTFQKEDGAPGYGMHIIQKQCAADIADIVQKINETGQETIFLGDGVDVYRDTIGSLISVEYSFAPPCCNRQRAACVASLGMVLYKKGIYQTAGEHAPEYLRQSQAERERAGKNV